MTGRSPRLLPGANVPGVAAIPIDEVTTQVLYAVDEVGVATVTFHRPEVLNAVTPPMGQRYLALLRQAEADPAVRVVVVTGAGRGFCAGADLGWLAGAGASSFEPDPDLPAWLPLTMSKPLVAAVNGPAAGVGLVHAVMADLRFAAAGAKLAFVFPRLGLVAEYGTAWLLPRLVGTGHAADLLLSGRTLLAEEALAMGLVQRVLPADEVLTAALAWARDVAVNCSPRSLAAAKEQLRAASTGPVAPAVQDAVARMHDSFGWPDLPAAVTARAQGRPPTFPPIPTQTPLEAGHP